MGVHIPNGYHVVVPSLQLTGSTHIFQVALMGKTKVGDNVSATNTSWRDALAIVAGPLAPAQMYTGWSVTSIKCSQMDAGILTVDENVSPIVGTKSGTVGAPCNVSILTKKNTGIAGRRYRGRAMWPDLWVDEANISMAGIIDATGQALVNARMNAMDARLLVLGIQMYLGHSSSEVAPTVLTGPMVCVTKVGTIKRRLRGSS